MRFVFVDSSQFGQWRDFVAKHYGVDRANTRIFYREGVPVDLTIIANGVIPTVATAQGTMFSYDPEAPVTRFAYLVSSELLRGYFPLRSFVDAAVVICHPSSIGIIEYPIQAAEDFGLAMGLLHRCDFHFRCDPANLAKVALIIDSAGIESTVENRVSAWLMQARALTAAAQSPYDYADTWLWAFLGYMFGVDNIFRRSLNELAFWVDFKFLNDQVHEDNSPFYLHRRIRALFFERVFACRTEFITFLYGPLVLYYNQVNECLNSRRLPKSSICNSRNKDCVTAQRRCLHTIFDWMHIDVTVDGRKYTQGVGSPYRAIPGGIVNDSDVCEGCRRVGSFSQHLKSQQVPMEEKLNQFLSQRASNSPVTQEHVAFMAQQRGKIMGKDGPVPLPDYVI